MFWESITEASMPDEVSRDMSWSSLMIRRWEEEDIVGGGECCLREWGWG